MVTGRVKPGNVSLGSLEKTCALIRQAGDGQHFVGC